VEANGKGFWKSCEPLLSPREIVSDPPLTAADGPLVYFAVAFVGYVGNEMNEQDFRLEPARLPVSYSLRFTGHDSLAISRQIHSYQDSLSIASFGTSFPMKRLQALNS
jgi:hypothetical protein